MCMRGDIWVVPSKAERQRDASTLGPYLRPILLPSRTSSGHCLQPLGVLIRPVRRLSSGFLFARPSARNLPCWLSLRTQSAIGPRAVDISFLLMLSLTRAAITMGPFLFDTQVPSVLVCSYPKQNSHRLIMKDRKICKNTIR